jgi:hypothetical protein
MKKLKISPKNKLIISLTSFALLIVLILINLITSPSQPSKNTTESIPLPQPTTFFKSPNQFIWEIDLLKLPDTIDTISTKPNTQAEAILNNLAAKLNFTNKSTTIPNTPLIVFNNQPEATTIYLNTDDLTIQFSFDLLSKPSLNDTNIKSVDQINQDTLTLLNNSLNLPATLTLTKTSTQYQTTNGPRFINTTPENAKLVKSTYGYTFNSLPILFPNGNSIETIHALSGKPIKFTINLPPNSVQIQSTYNTKSIEEIKATPQDQFTTFMLKGNDRFELSDQEIDIETATITNGFLGYLNNKTQNTLDPMIFLTGTIKHNQYGQLEILLGIPALSPSSYN